ncbi:MAG: HigA family addiction module antidote protein [Deltaproteobacteria bacterium]|nr:HigA family addiction module antidote protein [Deltaproteobacteria bacterium]
MRIRTHPGEVLLEEFLKPLGLSAHGLALAIGVPPTRIADIVHQRRGVSADTATRLARYFGTTAEFWCNLQSAHELSVVAATKQQELAHIIPHGEGTAPATAVL